MASRPYPIPEQADAPQLASWWEDLLPAWTAAGVIGTGGYQLMKSYVFDQDVANIALETYSRENQQRIYRALAGYARRRGEM